MPYMDTVKLAAGDYNPQLTITLKDSKTGDASNPTTWDPIDLSAATKMVKLVIYALGEATPLAEITCTKISGGSTGQVFAPIGSYQFTEAGVYVADIKVYDDDKPVTVYDQVRFRVR